jgi:hypothetical protein
MALAMRLAAIAGALVLALGAAGWRLSSLARAELAASDDAWRRGDAAAATVHARGAARAWVPGADHMERAYARLREVATTSERQGDTAAALFAWRAALSARAASRPFSTCGETCEAAPIAIGRLAAAGASARAPSIDPRPRIVPAVAVDVVPPAHWGAVIVVAAGLMIAAGYRLARAFASGAGPVRGEVRAAVALGGAGLAAWVVAIFFA